MLTTAGGRSLKTLWTPAKMNYSLTTSAIRDLGLHYQSVKSCRRGEARWRSDGLAVFSKQFIKVVIVTILFASLKYIINRRNNNFKSNINLILLKNLNFIQRLRKQTEFLKFLENVHEIKIFCIRLHSIFISCLSYWSSNCDCATISLVWILSFEFFEAKVDDKLLSLFDMIKPRPPYLRNSSSSNWTR